MWRVGAALLLLVACSESEQGGLVSDVPTEPDAKTGSGDSPLDPSCADFEHDSEGGFSENDAGIQCEWKQSMPCAPTQGSLYVDFEKDDDGDNLGTMHVLLDWERRVDSPVGSDEFALFRFVTGGGQEQWVVRVYGNGNVMVMRNGWEFGEIVEAGTGFSVSPKNAEIEHAIFEFSLPATAGDATVMIDGPDNDGSSVHYPRLYMMTLSDGAFYDIVFMTAEPENTGGCEWVPVNMLLLLSIMPPRGVGGDEVVLGGIGFGMVPGSVYFGEQKAEVINWTPMSIKVVVPPITEDVRVQLRKGTDWSNELMFYYDCTVDCEDDCDPAECPGKPCGICPEPTYCIDGQCLCEIQCANKECGDNGCGGHCGVCPLGEGCVEGRCECIPDCPANLDSGACGPDGCGGVCGECAPGSVCNDNLCCTPKCDGKQCGADSCGGTCGTCQDGYQCSDGSCLCVPNCGVKHCGPNGCGGVCGICAEGWNCLGGACKCDVDCDGKECGDNGCGGSCGSCPTGKTCTKTGICSAT